MKPRAATGFDTHTSPPLHFNADAVEANALSTN